jgi:hypothetical protein
MANPITKEDIGCLVLVLTGIATVFVPWITGAIWLIAKLF